jgi:hypothetical protein
VNYGMRMTVIQSVYELYPELMVRMASEIVGLARDLQVRVPEAEVPITTLFALNEMLDAHSGAEEIEEAQEVWQETIPLFLLGELADIPRWQIRLYAWAALCASPWVTRCGDRKKSKKRKKKGRR